MLHNDKLFSYKPRDSLKIARWLSSTYLFKLFLVIFSVVGLMWAGQKFDLFPIRYIKIVGSNSVELNTALYQTIDPLTRDKTHRVNLQTLESQLKQWSCVEKIILLPILPYTLIIHVRIREPIATFHSNEAEGKVHTQWIDSTGFLFQASPKMLKMLTNHLPTLMGPNEKSTQLLNYYQAFNALLKPQSLQPAKVRLDQQDRCSLELTNGIQLLLGHLDPLRQLQQLLDTHPSVLHQADKITTLDLRYPTGMAITWRESTL